MAKKKKDEPSNKERLVRFFLENEAKSWTLPDMTQYLWGDDTPGLRKMAFGAFTGARRILLDNADFPRLVIPIQWEGRRASTWKFADANVAQERAFVLKAITTREHMIVGSGISFERTIGVANRLGLIAPDDATRLLEAMKQGARA